MKYVKGAVAVLTLLAIILFSVQNLEVINVAFLSWSMSVPKVIVIAGTYLLGMVTGAWLWDFLKYVFRSKPANGAS